MNTETALIRAETGLSTIQESDKDDIFILFRRVFDATRCRKRLVYWVEQKFGQTILRQCLRIERESKKEDRLITTLSGPLDLNAVRLTIANANVMTLRTGIRWEVYADFACTEQLDMGRFDHIDLLADMDPDELKRISLAGRISMPTGTADWDFDALLLTNTCPQCKKMLRHKTLLYQPNFQSCRKCGYRGLDVGDYVPGRSRDEANRVAIKEAEVNHIALKLMALVLENPSGLLGVDNLPEREDVEIMIDVHATPVFAWLFVTLARNTPVSVSFTHGGRGAGSEFFTFDNFKACYQRSIFRLMKMPLVRDKFTAWMLAESDTAIEQARCEPDDPMRELRLKNLIESRENLLKFMKVMETFDDWLYDGLSLEEKADFRVAEKRREAINEAVLFFPDYIESILRSIGQRLIDEDTGKGKAQ